MEEFMKELGEKFYKLRNKNKWSLKQVKIKIDSIPPEKKFSTSEISRVEQGERKNPNPVLISKLCKIYGMDDVEIFRKAGFLCKNNQQEIETSARSINVFNNIIDAMNAPIYENKELAKFLFDEEIMENSLNLVRVFIKNEDVPNELSDTVWVLIDRGVEVSDGEIGVFLYQDKYLIRKKVISTDGGITLIGKDNKITVIRNTAQYKELGKIIKELKSF